MFKKILLIALISLFFVNFNVFAISKECSLPVEKSISDIDYRFILEHNYPKYIKIVDNVLEKFDKKIENKNLKEKIFIYKKIDSKIKNILNRITNPVSKNVIGYLSEEIKNKISHLDINICENIVSGKSNIPFISNIKKEKSKDTLIISGKLVFGVDKVVITYENASGEFPIDIYKLHNFKPGDRTFKYNASYKFKNLDNGTNYYKITAYIGEKKYSINTSYKESSIVKTEEKNIYKKIGKYCVLDTCLDSSKGEIIKEDNKFVQEKTKSYIYVDKSEIFKQSEDGLEIKSIFIKDLDRVFVKIQEGGACGSYSIKQEFFDGNLKKLSETYLKNYMKNKYGLEKSIKIGNYTYNAKLNFKEFVTINSNEVKEGGKIFSLNDIKEFINKEIKNKNISKKYIFKYEKNGMKFDIMYEANFVQPERLVYLGTDQNWLNENIDSYGNLLDLGVTNKILAYYGEGNVKGVTTKDGNRIFKAEKNNLAIFKVKKFNNSGIYMLYPSDGYKFVVFVEMCKPAVYIYNNLEEKNTLYLQTNQNNYFTKLIPDFTEKNSWEFSSKNGKIKVKNKNYDYLYYAIKVKNYSHNQNGWIVSGKNIEKFFLDKLEKINFNQKEKQDFLEYWIPKYDKNKYYFVSFKYKEDLDKLISFKFSKKPNKIFRVLLDSYELENFTGKNKDFLYSKIGDKFDKYLIKKFDRNNSNYEVFEWGGVLVKKNETFVY